MKIGIWGAGKLGLPVALAIDASEAKHQVGIYDIREEPYEILESRQVRYIENDMQELLEEHTVKAYTDPGELIKDSEIIFIAVQTPHDPAYEGITLAPPEKKDFNYKYLKSAVEQVSHILDNHVKEPRTVVIISTVLPGTIEREIKPIMSQHMRLIYNPFFIAMGTTIEDFLNPEFVLVGWDSDDFPEHKYMQSLIDLYESLHSKPIRLMNIKEAELTKVAYNTFISMKIVYANTIMEICDKMGGMDADTVMGALKEAEDRIISPAYLTPGMGDGGGCHPRDNIAMSYLAQKLNLSYDIFHTVTSARERQTIYLSDQVAAWHKAIGAPVWILGTSYKLGINLTTGSPAILLANILKERHGIEANLYNRFDTNQPEVNFEQSVFFMGLADNHWHDFDWPEGSVIIDPWRYMPDLEERGTVEYVPIGADYEEI